MAMTKPADQAVSPRSLEYFGGSIFRMAHIVVGRIAHLPKPLGPTAAVVRPFVQPLVETMESCTLQILSFLDDQIYAVGGVIEKCIDAVSSSPKQAINEVQAAVGKIRRRGLLGSTADIWVDYEVSVRSTSEKVAGAVLQVPGLNRLSPVFGAVAYGLSTVSSWMLEHSESKLHENVSDSEVDEQLHAYVEEKVAAADDDDVVDENKEIPSPSHAYVKEKVEEEGKTSNQKKLQHDEDDETDELTKLLDAGWCLGSL